MKKSKKIKSFPKAGMKKPKKEVIFDGGQGELDRALEFAWDVTNRAGLPICLVKETARQLRDGERLHHLPCLEAVVLEGDYSVPTKKMLKIVLPKLKLGKNKFELLSEDGVPIRFEVIRKQKRFFKYADTVFYNVGEFRIPNSWDAYWKMRHLVK